MNTKAASHHYWYFFSRLIYLQLVLEIPHDNFPPLNATPSKCNSTMIIIALMDSGHKLPWLSVCDINSKKYTAIKQKLDSPLVRPCSLTRCFVVVAQSGQELDKAKTERERQDCAAKVSHI